MIPEDLLPETWDVDGKVFERPRQPLSPALTPCRRQRRWSRRFFDGRQQIPSRHEILERFEAYVAEQLGEGEPLHRMTKHVLGLFKGEPRARLYRRILSEEGGAEDAGLDVLRRAAACTRTAQMEAPPIAAE